VNTIGDILCLGYKPMMCDLESIKKIKPMFHHIQHPLRINVSHPWFKDKRSPWRCHEIKKQKTFQVQVALMDLQSGGSKRY
jgi:hypothetical protein